MGSCFNLFVVLVAALIAAPFGASYFAPQKHSLAGKCAVLTGASAGIGVTIANELALQKVSKIVIAARSEAKLNAVAASLAVEHTDVDVLAVRTDVADSESRKNLLAKVDEFFGDDCTRILVNNAGVLGWKRFEDATESDIDTVLNVNLNGLIQLTRLFYPGMLKQNAGHVVNIASVAGKIGGAMQHSYTASKHGVVGFTKSMRGEVQMQGSAVTLHSICPGFVTGVGMAADVMAGLPGYKETVEMAGSSTPQDSADAVVLAIEYDIPEIIVNSIPMRWLFTLNEAMPRFIEWLPEPDTSVTFFNAIGDAAH